MKILGISGSPRKKGTTAELVQSVLEGTGVETEFVTLAGKDIRACSYCLGCAKTNVCIIKDYAQELREKIIEADGLVIGGCNMWSTLNGTTHNLLERFFQFHHRGRSLLRGKPVASVATGGGSGDAPLQVMNSMLQNFGLQLVGSVAAQGAFACYSCGIGNKCEVSMVQDYLDENGEIDMRFKPDLSKQPEIAAAARNLGTKLAGLLA